MLSTKLKEAAGNSADATLYVNDVFSTYLYTGNNVDGRLIQNDIDLLTKGGMVWIKARSSAQYHTVADTNRGMTNTPQLATNTNDPASGYYISSYANNGFSVYGGAYGPGANATGITYASWTFRKAAKFFDVVTYTGTGSARTIAHSLGVAPGMVIVKRTDTTGNWQVYHRSLTSAANSIQLNLTNAQASAPTVWNSTAPTSSVFSVGTDATVNASGGTYVAYLYAHDTSSTGIIQCGSFTTDASGNATVNLGWEPQYWLYKNTGGVGDWQVYDTMRGWSQTSIFNLSPSTSSAEGGGSATLFYPTATGFNCVSGALAASATYIYMAIRRPNKPPTTGTQVYNAIARTGTGAVATVTGVGFAPDLVQISQRPLGSGKNWVWFDRLRGGAQMVSSDNTGAEFTNSVVIQSDSLSTTMDGFRIQTANPVNSASYTYINYSLKRAPGFFDVVCYTGVGAADVKYHNLNAIPELMIVKNRSNAYDWYVFATTANQQLVLNSSAASQGAINLLQSYSSTTFKWVDTSLVVNGNTMTYVAYLFATLAGISKVGSYTGNGGTQTINCGFTGGARFVLIKRTDSTGGWYVFDTARGMTTLTDPYLLLNSTAAEVATLGAVTSVTTGFAVNAAIVAAINTNAASYIFLAIA